MLMKSPQELKYPQVMANVSLPKQRRSIPLTQSVMTLDGMLSPETGKTDSSGVTPCHGHRNITHFMGMGDSPGMVSCAACPVTGVVG